MEVKFMKKKIITLLVCVIVTFLIFRIRDNEKLLYIALRNHVETYGESRVTLGELTDFEWEQAVYFSYTNPATIYETAGVHFTQTDLTIGILFLNNGEIVYYELFPQRLQGAIDLHRIRIKMQVNDPSIETFEPDDVFDVGVTEDHFGDTLYWMRTDDFEHPWADNIFESIPLEEIDWLDARDYVSTVGIEDSERAGMFFSFRKEETDLDALMQRLYDNRSVLSGTQLESYYGVSIILDRYGDIERTDLWIDRSLHEELWELAQIRSD